MPKRDNKAKPVARRILKSPWPVVTGIFFCLLLALSLFFLVEGISPEIDTFLSGSIGISMLTNANGEIVLYPMPGLGAEKAGVENFDILLTINGKPINPSVDINQQLRGRVGEPITITVRKADGSEKSYTIIRTSQYQDVLDKVKLTPAALAVFYIALSLLVGLGFAALAVILLLRHASEVQFILTAFVLLLLPCSLNAVSMSIQGAGRLQLDWLWIALRVTGLFLAGTLIFLFPNGQFVSRWSRWVLIIAAIWTILYYIALINPKFLPGSWIDLVWVAIVAFGLALQIYRFRRISSEMERQETRRVGYALLIALAVYLVIWLLELFLQASTLSNASGVWFYLTAEFLVDASFTFFGVSLMLATLRMD